MKLRKSGVLAFFAAAMLLTGCSDEVLPEFTTVPRPTIQETIETTAPPVTSPALPEDYDLPVSQVPEALPDICRVADLSYEETPRFSDEREVARYFLHQFLNGQFKMDLYVHRDLLPPDGSAMYLLSSAVESALTYYSFGAYMEYSMYAEDVGDPEYWLCHVDLRYENPDYDLEARAEALEYVLKHPVPQGGFRDPAAEREYCRGIHDYLIGRISYDPIGYGGPETLQQSQYDNKQEAYNVLVSEDTSAVCAGYARGFALIAQYAGIDCAYVTGNEVFEPEPESHAWNVVYPCDGSDPVLVDVTWDDPDLVDEAGNAICHYGYFYIPLDVDQEHTMDPTIEEFLRWIHESE